MKLTWKREILPFVLLAAMVAAAVYYYPLLPNSVPSQFGMNGKPYGWMSKLVFFPVMGTTFLLIYLLLTFLPRIDPLKRKIEMKFGIVLFFRDAVLIFFTVTFFLSLQAAREGMLQVDFFGIAFGLLLLILGNYMPKTPQNWFVGIRTPWTISSEVVWKKTHILGGWLFTLSGLVFIICDSLKLNRLVPFAAVLAAAGISALYSFCLFKKLEKAESL